MCYWVGGHDGDGAGGAETDAKWAIQTEEEGLILDGFSFYFLRERTKWGILPFILTFSPF